ncbi:hypothetical protein [Budvicia aquatica]|uniref:hypothetical protein n=1 Tax=Budvicia aquatica TaxID=82979 RepID=UPI00208B4AA7|nr:hypothetical protein [Budvicia aquatica]GKX50621.1 hypothetical protein SOASR029_09300 [Budvicia aquatica]
MGVQGLADGFLAGFQTADGAISRDKELTLRDASLQHQIKDSDRTYSLRDAEQKHRVKTDERDFNYKGERDKVGDQQWTLSHALNKQQVGISAANSKLNRQKFEFELDAAKRHELDKQSEPFIYAMQEAIANKDYESAWKFSEKLPKHSPYKMDYWKEADTQKGVDTTFDNMSDMLTGKVDPASPELSKAITLTLGPELSVGVGSKLPDGRTIVGKEVANVLPAKDGQPGVYVTLRNKLDDGSTYEAPVTKYRSHDKEDKEVMFVPYEKIQKVIGERKQMVDMMRSPGMVDYLANTLNRMNKKDSGSIKEYRSALLDVDKDEAKQMADLNKDGAMLDDAQKAAAVKAIQEGANQRRERVGQLFGVGSATANEPKESDWTTDPEYAQFEKLVYEKLKQRPDPNNPATKEIYMQWRQGVQQAKAQSQKDSVVANSLRSVGVHSVSVGNRD